VGGNAHELMRLRMSSVSGAAFFASGCSVAAAAGAGASCLGSSAGFGTAAQKGP
jgi:hypothetical protein